MQRGAVKKKQTVARRYSVPALDKALNYCRESGEDINAFFAPVLAEAASKAAKEFSKKNPKQAALAEAEAV